MGYIIVNNENTLFGKSDDELATLFKDIAEVTHADFKGSDWCIGIDFGHMKDYIPNEPISESVVSSLMIFCEDNTMDEFFTDFNAWCEGNKAKVSDYKSIEHVSKIMQQIAEKAQEYQNIVLN